MPNPELTAIQAEFNRNAQDPDFSLERLAELLRQKPDRYQQERNRLFLLSDWRQQAEDLKTLRKYWGGWTL